MDSRLPTKVQDDIIPEPNSGCWLWLGVLTNGYPRKMIILPDGKRKSLNILRYIWETLRGPIPTGKIVLHACDNRACVNPDHLSIGTNQDNYDDMIRKGRRNLKFKERAYRLANHKPSGHLKRKMYYIP